MKNIFFMCVGLLMMNIIVAQSGNVGIGTTTPVAKLDIIGSIKITDGTQGLGKVLVSDAAGKASWTTIASVNENSIDPASDYPVVSIGCNTWMTKNLEVVTYQNGDSIPLVTDNAAWAALTTGAYCYYSNNPDSLGAIYGILYNWYAVNSPKGLAPEGWHIPSDFEWTTLVGLLGGNASAGGPMKALGTVRWNVPNLGATNICNFAALPGGRRTAAGVFQNVGTYGYWWSSSAADGSIAWSRNLNYNDMKVGAAGSDKNFGYAVRCVKN